MAGLRRAIEDGVISLLAPLVPLWTLKQARPYNAQISDAENAEAIKRVFMGNTPGVMVQATTAIYQGVSLTRKRHVALFNVDLLVASSSLRGREEVTRDDVPGGARGIYDVLEKIHLTLAGAQVPAQGAGRLSPIKEEAVVQLPDLCLWLVTYNLDVDVRQQRPSTDADLTEVRSYVAPPVDEDLVAQGSGDALAYAAGEVTITDAAGLFAAGHVGMSVAIAGAAQLGNNSGIPFRVTAVPSSTTLKFSNPHGANEPIFAGTWKIHPAAPAAASDTQ